MATKGRTVLFFIVTLYTTYLISIAESNKKKATNEELRLFEDLFIYNKYDNSVRPVKNKTRPVQVYLDVALVQLVDLDDGAQVMETNIWIRLKWKSELLVWNASQYDGVTSIVVDKMYPWKPDIVLYNNAENGKHMGSITEFLTRIEVRHDGLNTWYIPAILKSSCGTDVTYFPFDTQLCTLKFGSWTYLSHEINLTKLRPTMDLSAYLKSSSFHLRSANAVRNEKYYPCCEHPFVDITYELVLDRQPGFHFYNVILPSLIITAFAVMNFLLPDLIGERVGLMFDCFLAITFTSMMVKDMMPVSSDTVPVITKFMLMCMGLIYLSLLTSSFSLVCRMRIKMPVVIRKIFIDLLGPLLFVTECYDAVKLYCTIDGGDDEDGFPLHELPSPRIPWYHQTSDSDFESDMYEPSYSSGYPGTSENSYRISSRPGSRHQNDIFTRAGPGRNCNDQPFSSGYNSLEKDLKASKRQLECMRNIEVLLTGEKQKIQDENTKSFWDFVSKLADRVFLIAFIFSWLAMAAILFLKVPPRSGSGR